MSEKKVGRVVYRQSLSSVLQICRVVPEPGTHFPEYKAGQHIALSRDNCKLTKRIIDEEGLTKYVYDLDEAGKPRRGPVTRSYTISSAPYETRNHGYLEFYIALELIEMGAAGGSSESLFLLDPETDSGLYYTNHIVGKFTFDRLAAGFQNIVMVGTGTGLAPFASMIKQLHFDATQGKANEARVTLFHANRTANELGYHKELLEIESLRKIDFAYVPVVSSPISHDYNNRKLGKGRANNILRSIFDMPLKEEENVHEAVRKGENAAGVEKALQKATRPVLPHHHTKEKLLKRMKLPHTVILACGNAQGMDDVQYIAEKIGSKFEKEEW